MCLTNKTASEPSVEAGRCISEALDGLEDGAADAAHGEGTAAIVHDSPRTRLSCVLLHLKNACQRSLKPPAISVSTHLTLGGWVTAENLRFSINNWACRSSVKKDGDGDSRVDF